MVAIIPARGGSKGLPQKNIRNFLGQPLISYTINAAKKSRNINRIIVSTDDSKIASISKQYGAEVPFLRPKDLATDESKAIDTYLFTIEELNENLENKINEFIVLLPTTPLRTTDDIDKAIKLFNEVKADTVISVYESNHPPAWFKKVLKNGKMIDYYSGLDSCQNRQQYEKAYLPNGAIYIFNFQSLKKNYSYFNNNTYPYIMDKDKSIDIDTLLDFTFAEFIMKTKINDFVSY